MSGLFVENYSPRQTRQGMGNYVYDLNNNYSQVSQFGIISSSDKAISFIVTLTRPNDK